ncbi:MAG: hypothetical protein A2046_12050 [Bacteroidetes bacterium GWA2_30_7]|nr:MAG: hypothetical protein A2046_12050 [Bacteroidetes bacterium GWA2_30_7]
MIIKIIFICIISIFISLNLFADNNKDIDSLKNEIENNEIINNLDSLLNLWYISNSLTSDYSKYADVSEDTVYLNSLPSFSDSIYISRLNKLSTLVGLPYNEKVRDYINAYTIKHRKRVEIMLGLTNYYFPIFEEILDKYNLPLELKYLAIIESALNPGATSRAGAAGLWQFMYTTGKIYKLNVNTFVDDRRDPIKSTEAAAQFLSDLYKIYDDWILAIAAYNCGPGNVNKAIKRSKGKNNYWEIYHYLPKETRGYVPAYIAATYVMNYYSEHNIVPKKINFPVAVDTIMITEDLHFGQISEVLNIPMDMLRDLNPQYRKDIIPAKNETYSLTLPSEYTTRFLDLSDSIFLYKDSIFFVTKPCVIPSKNGKGNFIPDPPSDNLEAISYKVRSGDNITAIARKYNVNVNNLKYWNNIHRNLIKVGQKLIVYVPKNSSNQVLADAGSTSVKTEEPKSENISSTNEQNDEFVYYKVKSGDNLWEIAKRFPGVSNTDIMELNNIKNSKSLKPGQVLKIKKK